MKIALMILLFLLSLAEETFAASGELEKVALRIGYTRNQFHGINQKDAEAAFRTLSRTVGRTHGYDVTATAQAFESSDALNRALQNEILHILILDSWSYLEIKETTDIEPMFVHADQNNVLRRSLLLTKNDTMLSIEDLKGKRLNILSLPATILGQKWFTMLLWNKGIRDPRDYFDSVEYFDKPMAAVLPVFFGKKEAVLVDEIQYELMAELNPQLAKLRVVIASEPMLDSIVCFSLNGWKSSRVRQALHDALLGLHESAAGRQILTLFKTEKTVPYNENYLQSVEKMFHKARSTSTGRGAQARRPL